MTQAPASPRSGEVGCARRSRGGVMAQVVGLVAGSILLTSSPPSAAAERVVDRVAAAAPATADWTTYHHDNSRAGYDSAEPTFTHLFPAWTQATLTGQIYASPLVYGGTVYIATEDNNIYALDAGTGAVQWSKPLST